LSLDWLENRDYHDLPAFRGMTMRLLIVEDDAALARGLTKAFRDQGLAVDHVSSGRDALEIVELEPYSAIVLDLGLPDMDGLNVLRAVRQLHLTIPVLILTARDATSDRVAGLDRGADDYLSKPFELAELEARVRALIRRGHGGADPVLCLGKLRLDRSSGAVYLSDKLLEITRRERAVLETLIVRVGSVVPKARLAGDVFGYDDPVAPNAVEVYVARLRRKLENSGAEIVTVHGLGYLLRAS
jgi:DNA-binding response OmpR family regulator